MVKNKVVCNKCGWHGKLKDTHTISHPYELGEILYLCPICLELESSMVGACDEPYCQQISTCGTPTDSGYRRTCGKHRPIDG